ncbi:pyridoxamine 5'-phosphate oxidase family protein [Alkalihalobacillus sp. MEB130]|uniref:pyridoxamine 5'-phosphate oxidase family protein n=1 Tax=Alkalihalobacillus sp. MEB130 TaxID=2976704 RepID=UPI0028DF88F4|nr:pyridoxamine 5'-phosphate oxidase family protein [Alkalihalobacillus sp. MEB130]MDT8861601.1 pyridoxamine 5'-phosphate oxidase family protein [Alkalihalobacillus sp. MEB130]
MGKQSGEEILQEKYNTEKRAAAFYKNQVLTHLNETMQKFIQTQEMMFISTSDSKGNCDSSFRAGEQGFVRILSEKMIMYPEFRGNGVMASMGNIMENPHIGLMFIDFSESRIGLHVNGTAFICENKELDTLKLTKEMKQEIKIREGSKVERWVVIEVEEAFIHCSKHVPTLKKVKNVISEKNEKGGDFFNVKQTKKEVNLK